jgi:hypothetical protein
MDEIFEKNAIDWLQKKIAEFVFTQQDSYENEWYTTDRKLAKSILDEFVEFVDHENIEKEKRRKLYEELKKEFGNE